LFGKRRHEPLKRGAELLRIQQSEKPAESIVAGDATLQNEEFAQKVLLGFREFRHIRRVLTAAKHRAQGNHQQIVEIMQSGIPGSGVFQTFPARAKFFQSILSGRVSHPTG